MTQVNTTTVLRRHQRPSENSKLLLDFYFIKDGAYVDPYQVCSVHVFPNTNNGVADGYLDLSEGSADYGLVSSVSAANFEFRNITSEGEHAVDPASSIFAETNYGGGTGDSSGIYKLGTGHLGVVLTPGASFVDYPDRGLGYVSGNTASATGKYMDIWTIMDSVGSRTRTYINQFELFSDGSFGVTEPITITPSWKLKQKYLQLGSKINIVVTTDFSFESPNMTAAVENLLQGALIGSAEMSIIRLNDDLRGSPFTYINNANGTGENQGWSTNTEILSDDTIMYYANTNLDQWEAGNYEVRVRCEILGETYISPPMSLVVQ